MIKTIFQGKEYKQGDQIRLIDLNGGVYTGTVYFGIYFSEGRLSYNRFQNHENLGFYVDYQNKDCSENEFFRETLPYVVNHMKGVLLDDSTV